MRLGYGQLKRLPRPEIPCPASLGKLDEILIANARAGLTAADMVERKLVHLLESLRDRQSRAVDGTESGITRTPGIRAGDSPTGQTPHPEGTCYASN